jgi:hypothetical protein
VQAQERKRALGRVFHLIDQRRACGVVGQRRGLIGAVDALQRGGPREVIDGGRVFERVSPHPPEAH